MRTWMVLDAVVVLAVAVSALSAVWLLLVVATVLPDRDPAGIPGWALFAVGLLGYVGLVVGRPRGASGDRGATSAIATSVLALIVGGYVLVVPLLRTTNFEGYLVVIGASVVVLGVAVLARELAGLARTSPRT